MSKILVLAEKPSVGKEIARVLGCKHSGNGYLSNSQYIVTWALGHLVTLCDPDDYDNRYKNWSLEQLPIIPSKMELSVIPKTAKQYHIVKNLLHDPQITSLIIATDAGREGELVARWILAKAGFSKPIRRLWISSQTDRAIKAGFSSLKDGKEYWNLYQSAQSRAEADWLVGFNITRALTCKYNVSLSAGRVQTPTLSIIVQREEEIKNFKCRDYWNVNANLGNFYVTYHNAQNQTDIFKKEQAEEISNRITQKSFVVTDIKRQEKSVASPMLYDLTELQRDANNLYHYSPKETLNILQRLYENYKAVTYPRTDSRYLTEDIISTLKDRLNAISFGEFATTVGTIFRENRSLNKACINNKKVSDHHAIIPTEEQPNLSCFSNEEKRIYFLIIKRFLSCFYPPFRYFSIRLDFICEGEHFSTSGHEIIDIGWKKIDLIQGKSEWEKQILPSVRLGESFVCNSVQVKPLRTSPPARYTEATLLSAMENPSRFIQDKKMQEYIGGGLGTPATRADIIEKLYAAFYIEKQGNTIVPTSKGIQLVQLVPPDLKEPMLTAKWEQCLEAIKNGRENKERFLSEIKEYTKKLLKDVIQSDNTYTHNNLTREICPECGKRLLMVNSKKGKMLICQDRICGYHRNIMMQTKVRCPNCHKFMELHGQGEKKMYVCRCGFHEKAETFFKNRKKNVGASKSYVKQYMKNQNLKEPKTISPFAAALAKAMEEKK